MDFWAWAWICWSALFLGLETAALVRKDKGDTLSEHVWRLLDVTNRNRGAALAWHVRLRRSVLVMGLAWLVVHLLTGGWA
jgi:hypothetical protein